jgi:3-hydroxyisobutyrate dehydrogenase-like beta-hydroxyacid dehydrogenase
MKSVGFVGFGEAARCFAGAFSNTDTAVGIFCNGRSNRPPYSTVFLSDVEACGAKAYSAIESLLAETEVVVSAVTVDTAEAVGMEVIEKARADQLVVDINASTPSVKRRLSEAALARDVPYSDASIMGAVSIYGVTVQILASGSGAHRFVKEFEPYGFRIDVLENDPVAAAGVKMLRSVVTKGMEALLVEALTAAQLLGIVPAAFEGICGPMDATTFSDFARMCIKTDVLHSGRREVEMREIAEELISLGVDPVMSQATAARLQTSASFGLRERFLGKASYDYEEVLAAYAEVLAAALG